MTDHAYNAEVRYRREQRVQRAQEMRANGASSFMIASTMGVGINTDRKYLAQSRIGEDCKPQPAKPQKKRKCLRCQYDFKPPHSGRFICPECTKTIARMG